jgi:hypothetical protein
MPAVASQLVDLNELISGTNDGFPTSNPSWEHDRRRGRRDAALG